LSEEAGRIGGEKTSETHSHDFYIKIGGKGGPKVQRLIQEGKKYEEE
jgi:hypothetical protein